MKRQLIVGALVVAVAGITSGSTAAAADLAVGDVAPPFTLKGSNGNTYSLDQYRGERAVVLAWFPKAFTGG